MATYTRLIGIMQTGARTESGILRVNGFKRELAELGWTEGGNVRFEERWANSEAERLPVYAAELVRLGLRPDVQIKFGLG
jgi:putative tryptophan/tyrosine transport system substrate-binding protein